MYISKSIYLYTDILLIPVKLTGIKVKINTMISLHMYVFYRENESKYYDKKVEGEGASGHKLQLPPLFATSYRMWDQLSLCSHWLTLIPSMCTKGYGLMLPPCYNPDRSFIQERPIALACLHGKWEFLNLAAFWRIHWRIYKGTKRPMSSDTETLEAIIITISQHMRLRALGQMCCFSVMREKGQTDCSTAR